MLQGGVLADSSQMINGAWDILMVIAVWLWWVETKGKTLEEIDEIFDGEKHTSVTMHEIEKNAAIETITEQAAEG